VRREQPGPHRDVQCQDNRFSSVLARKVQREWVRRVLRFVQVSDVPCIRRVRLLRGRVPSESGQVFRRRGQFALVVVRVPLHAGRDSATYRAA
jgi:hypothetical protein